MPNQYFKKSLMYRVYMVYLARKVLNRRGLGVGWLAFCTVSLLSFVSILNVARNFWAASSDFSSAYGFVAHSVSHTSLGIQAVLLGFLVVAAFFAFDLYRTYLYSR